MEVAKYITGTGQILWTHTSEQCQFPCPIHYPSYHALSHRPTHWRNDRGIMERICEHGVGHPDPDDIKVREGDWTEGVHGCDGCCSS